MLGLPRKAVALLATMVVATAAFGASLGLVAAGEKETLFEGANPAYGGPISTAVEPDHWVSCLPASSWRAVYLWEPSAQSWRHYFNTTKGIPGYVNSEEVGAIGLIPRLAGVVMIMDQQVDDPFMPDSASQDCPT